MNFNVSYLATILYSENYWRDTSIVLNLGINATLSRKLLTSKPDTKIGQTIVINSGRRSTRLRKNLGRSKLCAKAVISLAWTTGGKNCLRAVFARGTSWHISTKESSSIFTSSSPRSILSAWDRLSYLINKTWPHIVASHMAWHVLLVCVCKRWHLKKSAQNMWYHTPRLTRYGIRDEDIIPSIIIHRESLRAISSLYLLSFVSLLCPAALL